LFRRDDAGQMSRSSVLRGEPPDPGADPTDDDALDAVLGEHVDDRARPEERGARLHGYPPANAAAC
jgi:hypothetical protein